MSRLPSSLGFRPKFLSRGGGWWGLIGIMPDGRELWAFLGKVERSPTLKDGYSLYRLACIYARTGMLHALCSVAVALAGSGESEMINLTEYELSRPGVCDCHPGRDRVKT